MLQAFIIPSQFICSSMMAFEYMPGDLPVTERVVSQILSLLLYAEISDEEIKYVVKAIRIFLGAN